MEDILHLVVEEELLLTEQVALVEQVAEEMERQVLQQQQQTLAVVAEVAQELFLFVVHQAVQVS